jgi:hypothetical protein
MEATIVMSISACIAFAIFYEMIGVTPLSYVSNGLSNVRISSSPSVSIDAVQIYKLTYACKLTVVYS